MEMEVICISSDDESQKENKKDKFLTNSTETDIGALTHEKMDILFSDSEKVEENSLKRKKLHAEDEDETILNSTEKKIKLNFDQGTSKVINKSVPDQCSINVSEIHFVKSNCNAEPNKNQEVIENTQLIVKEKKRISYISQDVFPLFISLCLQKCPKHDKTDMTKIVDKLKRRYENLDPIYASSEDFVTFLNEKRKAITSNSKIIYGYIEEVMNEMKRNIKTKSQALQNNEIYDAVPSTSYGTNNVPPVNNRVELNNDDDYDDEEKNASPKIRRRIKEVSYAMKKCEAVIKKLEEEEVDFNEESDSNYIKVERYKRRMVELYNKLCELTGENTDAGRAYLRPKHLSVTRIVAVDQAITNFINSKITRRNKMKRTGALTNDLIFPDYRDILECVNRCNDKKNLGLDKRKREQMAEKAFKELGEHLQRTRYNDYWDTFSLYLENTEDPAVKDKNLAKKLADNRTEGEKRLAAVFEKYTKKQEEIKDQNNEETASEEEDEDDDYEEEEEESIIDDEDKNNENLSMTSEKDSDNEENINKTVKENKLPVEKNKPNIISMINVFHPMDKIISKKTIANTSQEKCDKTIKIKILKNSDMAVSKNENKTISEKIIDKPCNSNAILKNSCTVVQTVVNIKPQEDSPADSTIHCTKDLAEVETLKVSKAITDPATKKVTKDVADAIIGVTTELITGDAAELRTGDIAELIIEDAAELVTGDIIIPDNITETITENTTEVITDETEIITENVMDGAIENMPNNEQPEEKKKPVLRLRSFAKPPMTWEDSQHKIDKTALENASKVANQIKEIVDLTNEGTVKPPPVITKCAIQLGNKVVPIVKQTLLIPAKRNIISVQNITNNYLKMNTRTGQIIAPVRDICGSTIIQLPVQSTSQQTQLQNMNAIAVKSKVPLKGNKTILRIIPKNSLIIPKKSVVQSVSRQTDASTSTTK